MSLRTNGSGTNRSQRALSAKPLVRFFVLCIFGMACQSANANNTLAELTINLTDSKGAPVEHGVFIFEPQFALDHDVDGTKPIAIMNQIDKQFVPHVLVVEKGTEITFPNADNLFHHVYSFSPVKPFELKLYKEFTAAPLRFESPGVVDIGCNIHDWMLGYIVVSNTPYYGKTDQAGHMIVTLPVGRYKVQFWHPRVDSPDAINIDEITIEQSVTAKWQLNVHIDVDEGFDSGLGDY